jgi:hypothetical protein
MYLCRKRKRITLGIAANTAPEANIDQSLEYGSLMNCWRPVASVSWFGSVSRIEAKM